MTIAGRLRLWWQMQTGEEDTPFDGDTSAFFASLLFHMLLLLALGMIPLAMRNNQVLLTIAAPADEPEIEELTVPDRFLFSQYVSQELGADSAGGMELAMALAPNISDVSQVPSPLDIDPVPDGKIEINDEIQLATGPNFSQNLVVKGSAGEGVAGAAGAIDRLTYEILRSLEERKTLVVWLFDQSGSLTRQRAAINERFDRIYEQLGVIEAAGNPAFARHEDKPLLTSVLSFGQQINLLTPQPTDELAVIKAAVAGIELDETGVEKVFSSVFTAAERYKHFRTRSAATDQPERNVMMVVFTDERGDDFDGLERTIDICQRYGMPIHVVGVPAPFGLEETQVKWVDPDPEYDQTPQWGRVNQGPESLFSERLEFSFAAYSEQVDPMDSGFGPFALTRLCYETGGIYFAVHPNRDVHRQVSGEEIEPFSAHLKYFFDPQVMRRYRPDYVSADEYLKRAEANRSRAALLTAARKSSVASFRDPPLRFVRRSESELDAALLEAQKVAAKLEPVLQDLYATLAAGEADREREVSPRWQAGFDLAMGRVLAAIARAQAYQDLLAQARRGIAFQQAGSNTWRLIPAAELPSGSRSSEAHQKAVSYLQRVVEAHPDTPWALLARRELTTPIGWTWNEEFTDLAPRTAGGGGQGGDGQGHRDEVRQGEPRPQKRPLPKL